MLGHLPLHDPSALLADCDVRSLRFRQPSDVVLPSSGKAKRTHWREKSRDLALISNLCRPRRFINACQQGTR